MPEYDINNELEGVAVIGMAGRFPGAPSVRDFWDNLCNGASSVIDYSDSDLLKAGVSKLMLDNPDYVKRGNHIEDIDLFDAAFFGFTPRESECIDPQHRLFMECAWETFENAGYNPETYKGLVGVFGGCGTSSYLRKNISTNPHIAETLGDFQIMIGNDNDYFTSRISYKFNLRGPSINVQTACSTSLVAICMGYQNLITYQCDMALCGGSSLKIPSKHGYLYKEGFIFSPDGYCRAFDEEANGTVQGEGAASVLLKRLDEAVKDGDHIYAVIRGAAVNNDGVLKAGYTAPSIDGQAQVIALAQELADVEPETITYIETHGTGTPLGDPIEIAALTKAFRIKTEKKNFCAIGSLKTNIGHLDAAAGVAGFIKTVLSINNRMLLPSLNFKKPNSKLNIEDSPFFVNTKLKEWNTGGIPLRAGVSAFGIGGTNSHVVLEEAPALKYTVVDDKWKIVLLSARSRNSLELMNRNLSKYFTENIKINLSDAAYTLQVGRKMFDNRVAIISRDVSSIINAIDSNDTRYIFPLTNNRNDQPVVFMFTGQGSQHPGMTSGLYNDEPDFRKDIDNCAEILKPYLGKDLRDILYPDDDQKEYSDAALKRTEFVQPVLFAIEYAIARFWIKRGIRPSALIGHSLGEYTAACISGVFSLEDALRIVAYRGRLIQSLPSGSMLSVPLSADSISRYIDDKISLAVINGPELCVLSGETDNISSLEKRLHQEGVASSVLMTSHAFHSGMMDPACGPFLEELKKIKFSHPDIPLISDVSGTWIKSEDVMDPGYWVRHLREPVDFNKGIGTMISDGYRIFLEVGPENSLCSILGRIIMPLKESSEIQRIPTLMHPMSKVPDSESVARATAKLAISGAEIDWKSYYRDQVRVRIPMPTYVFDKKRHWVEPQHDSLKFNKMLSGQRITDEGISSGENNSAEKGTQHEDVEQLMIKIWAEILGYNELKLSDNFFDLGGDSLKATQLIALINRRMGLELTLTDLFIDPTIESIAKLVRVTASQREKSGSDEDTTRFPILFPIQPKGDNSPMYMVAGAHGNRYFDPVNMKTSYEEDFLRYLSQIIPHVGMDQPVFGIRPKGLDASETPHKTVQEMAAAYIKKIREFQPKGPYLIAGECVGGIVAYEMAQQLRASGQDVAHLILMDTHFPSTLFEVRERYLVIRRKGVDIIRTKFRALLNHGFRSCIHEIKNDLNLLPLMFFPITERLRAQRKILLRSYRYQNTLLRYRPAPYKGDFTLIINQEWLRKEPDMGWKDEFRKNLTVIAVPGDHATRLTTYGGVTGKHLRDIIKKAWDK